MLAGSALSKMKGGMPMDSQHYMRIALELARSAQGQTSPNPSVNGTGIGLLKVAGIEVITSTLQEDRAVKPSIFSFYQIRETIRHLESRRNS